MIDFLSICFISSNRNINGANEVVIYNFLALLTIDTNINQFIRVYHIFYKLQYLTMYFLIKFSQKQNVLHFNIIHSVLLTYISRKPSFQHSIFTCLLIFFASCNILWTIINLSFFPLVRGNFLFYKRHISSCFLRRTIFLIQYKWYLFGICSKATYERYSTTYRLFR